MQRLFASFPRGMAGYGLAILRLAVAADLFIKDTCPVVQQEPNAPVALLIAVSALLIIGLFTPLCAAACIAVEAWLLLNGHHLVAMTHVTAVLSATALCLLGPGAYSLDARLFGPRTVIVESGK